MFIKNNHSNTNNITILSINKPNMSKQKGFTLIELLVVIAVIIILTSMSLISYSNVRAKARDTTRISDLDQLQKLLEIMRLDNTDGKYPLSTENYQITGYPWGSEYEGFGMIPKDPLSDQSYAYVSDGETYQLYVKFENEPVNSSFACGENCGPEGGGYNGGVTSSGSSFASLPSEGNGGESSSPPSSPPPGLSPADAQEWARNYCQDYYPDGGISTLNGDVVYCDQYNNMWAPTLSETYKWSTEKIDITKSAREGGYGITSGNCNDLSPNVLASKYPACNACATLNYAGLSGWRLPSHTQDETYCCHWNSQLWLYGYELCKDLSSSSNPWTNPWGKEEDCNESRPRLCLPDWEGEGVAQDGIYWSAAQGDNTNAWRVVFLSAHADDYDKSLSSHVRCFLGHW